MGRQLKQLLQTKDRIVIVYGLGQLLHPKIIEIVAMHGGYDAVWFDHEHAGISTEQIELGARTARGCGLDSFVRLSATDYATVMRPLEAGAGGIMAAQVRNAAQAEQIVQWAKFHPRGQRGFNGLGIDGEYGRLSAKEYMARANAETFIAIQIEHAEAVEDVDRIAAVPDVDVLFVGPADLSQSMGIPGEWEHPRLWAALERIAEAGRRHGKAWAILPRDPAYARRCLDLGCRILSLGFDVWTIRLGLSATKAQYPEMFKS